MGSQLDSQAQQKTLRSLSSELWVLRLATHMGYLLATQGRCPALVLGTVAGGDHSTLHIYRGEVFDDETTDIS